MSDEGFARLWESAAGEANAPAGEADAPRRRHVGLIVTAIVVAVLLLGSGGYVTWAVTAPAPDLVFTEGTPPLPTPDAVALALPATGSAAVSVTGGADYLGEAGLYAADGADVPRPVASITKLITALVVLDARPLADANDPGPTITFSKADHDLYDEYYVQGATIVEMPTGSTMSERDALALMLIPSASNYAAAVSTWAYGSPGAFLSATDRWLTENGLTGTTIVEPTGISPRNTSTPTDLIALGRLAAAHPVIAALASSESVTVAGRGQFTNTNTLLGLDGVTGLKTGNLGEGAFTLLYTSSLDVGIGEPLHVVGVVLDGDARATVDHQVRALLESIRAGFHEVSLVTAGQVVGHYAAPWGGDSTVVTATAVSLRTWSDTPIVMTRENTAPGRFRAGDSAGILRWTAGPAAASAELRLSDTIPEPTIWWRLTHPTLLG